MASIAQAIRLALHVGETRLGVTDIFGEDVGPPLGGVFTATQGLKTAWNSPLDERGIIGAAMGLAFAGERPVCEIQFCDYIFNTIDLLKIAGNSRWSSNGQFDVPMVVMTPVGSGIHGSVYHSHSFDAMATHIQGWKVVLPSSPIDAYGLLISAIKDPNPVMFLYPKALIRVPGDEKIPGEPQDPKELSKMIDAPLGDRSQWKPKWPKLSDFEIPIGKAKVCREGDALTVVSYGRTLPLAIRAAENLKQNGHSDIEVIDLRTLFPLDLDTITASVQKTGRLLVVNEDTEVTNFGEHVIRKVMDTSFYHLQAAPKLLAGANTPGVGLAWSLEEVSVPQQASIEQAMQELPRSDAVVVDALFIIDEEYPTFPTAWQELHRLLDMTGQSADTIAEPLRITVPGKDANAVPISTEAESIGRHYVGEPTDSFRRQIADQARGLLQSSNPFGVRSEPAGDAHSLELRYDGKNPPKIVIPFDDTPDNSRRFFENYRKLLSPKKSLSFLPFGQTKSAWEYRERMETVGRHEIVQAYEIWHPSGDLDALLHLLREVYEVQRGKILPFYFQFFCPPSFSGISMPPESLFETTYQFSRISYVEADSFIQSLPSVADTFSVFEQKVARIDQPCSATYTLRRTKTGMYEIRVNAVWASNTIDPEIAVAPLEKKSGHAWARII